MDFKDFIIGEKYNISALAIEESFAMKKYAVFKLPTGRLFLLRAEDFEAVSPENGKKNTETTPKYYPCRLFRKGDKVKPRERNGRVPWAKDTTLTVISDEMHSDVVVRCDDTGEERLMCVLFLELVTPVEELEPYRVETGGYNRFRIKKGNLEYSYFPFGEHCVLSMDEAKAAAEAERDRLNAEYGKEREIRNGIIELDKALNKEILNHADAFLTRKEQK